MIIVVIFVIRDCVGGQVLQIVDGWVFFGFVVMIDVNFVVFGNLYVGEFVWDWIIFVGIFIYVVYDGTVSNICTWNKNWWDVGCGSIGGGECDICGIGFII